MTEFPASERRRSTGLPRGAQMVGGLLIALIAAAVLALNWKFLLTRGLFNVKAAMAAPAFMVIGVALMIIPGYREERIARGEDISQLHGMALITPRWWVVVGVALAAGFANWFIMNQQ